jgi:hypothetical protein
MASRKTTTAIVLGMAIFFVVLALAGILALIARSRAQAAQAALEKKLAAENPVEYKVQHQPLTQDESELKNSLVGTWRMAGSKSWGATAFTLKPANNGDFKTFTPTTWAVVTYDANSNVVYSGSGHYTLQGDLYTESIEAATGPMAQYIGAHPQFKIRLEGDKYYQMGTGNKPSIEEMWQRVEQ